MGHPVSTFRLMLECGHGSHFAGRRAPQAEHVGRPGPARLLPRARRSAAHNLAQPGAVRDHRPDRPECHGDFADPRRMPGGGWDGLDHPLPSTGRSSAAVVRALDHPGIGRLRPGRDRHPASLRRLVLGWPGALGGAVGSRRAGRVHRARPRRPALRPSRHQPARAGMVAPDRGVVCHPCRCPTCHPILPLVFAGVTGVTWRLLRLDEPASSAWLDATLVGMAASQVDWGLHYWRSTPLRQALLLGCWPTYSSASSLPIGRDAWVARA